MKIAVYSRDKNNFEPFLKCNKIEIFESGKQWRLTETINYELPAAGNLISFRKNINNIALLIKDCYVIAGGGMTGITFNVFDRLNYKIFEINDNNDSVLFGILEDIEKADITQRVKNEIIKNARPVETDVPGNYFLDLVLLQTECPEISSKKALSDFLNQTPFLELKLLCSHIPPWLENGCYNIEQQKTKDGKISAVITKACM